MRYIIILMVLVMMAGCSYQAEFKITDDGAIITSKGKGCYEFEKDGVKAKADFKSEPLIQLPAIDYDGG